VTRGWSFIRSARRGGRYPLGAHDGAVGTARRLRCGARSCGPAAELAARPVGRSAQSSSASQKWWRALRARGPQALRSSPLHKSPPAGTAHRAVTLVLFVDGNQRRWAKASAGRTGRAYEAPRTAGLRGLPIAERRWDGEDFELRAQRRSARSVAAARGRVPQPPSQTEDRRGPPKRSAGGASSKRPGLTAPAFASLNVGMRTIDQ